MADNSSNINKSESKNRNRVLEMMSDIEGYVFESLQDFLVIH
jgi:hypothetical protein